MCDFNDGLEEACISLPQAIEAAARRKGADDYKHVDQLLKEVQTFGPNVTLTVYGDGVVKFQMDNFTEYGDDAEVVQIIIHPSGRLRVHRVIPTIGGVDEHKFTM